MLLLRRACKSLGGFALLVVLPNLGFGQTTANFIPQAGEYSPAGKLTGDQVNPAVALNASGGYLVWQDNITDGDGLGISAVRFDGTFTPTQGNFRVNQNGANDQENAQVAMLQNGGAVFVWQGGAQSFQHIYARVISSAHQWVTGDIQVNTATNQQVNPQVISLTNGNIVITWASYGQDNTGAGQNNFQGVYAQVLSPAGQKIGNEFQVNTYTPFNQRTPAIAAFPNGNFVVTWISEQQVSSLAVSKSDGSVIGNNSCDVFAQVFDSSGNKVGGEFMVDGTTNLCANPSVAVASDNTYIIAWSQNDSANQNNSWDVYGRQFSISNIGGPIHLLNTQQYGDQFAPKISALGNNYLAIWTSVLQDGDGYGIFGQFLNADGTASGGEIQVNTTTTGNQEFPAIAADGVGHFLTAWSSPNPLDMDINAQRFVSTLQSLAAPAAPYVTAIDSFTLTVTWAPMTSFAISNYQVFADGATTPILVTNNNMWYYDDYNPGSQHTFRLAYSLANGQVSPLSIAASGTTWGSDRKGFGSGADGLPDDWETLYYGTNTANWPKNGFSTVLAPGVTVEDVFNWGANPTNSATWLKQYFTSTPEGVFLNWNTVPGSIYQVLSSADLNTWAPAGPPRLASGASDSIFLGYSNQGYYKIVRNRY